MPEKLEIIILAAGQGSRMQSNLPKVLHKIGGVTMLEQVIKRALALKPLKIHVVIGHKGDEVVNALGAKYEKINWVWQKEQKGTAHAIMQVASSLTSDSKVLILYGDVPLLDKDILLNLCNLVDKNTLGILTAVLDDATGYGRIVREQGQITRIVEHKDANLEELQIREINTGILALTSQHISKYLPLVSNDNAQQEYYLTDIIALAKNAGVKIESVQAEHKWQILGVNSRKQLLELEKILRKNLVEQLLAEGVSLADDETIIIRGNLQHGKDVFIDTGCIFEGEVIIEDGVEIGPYCVIKDAHIGRNTKVLAYTHIEDSEVADNVILGPYARLRPGAKIANSAKIGNFVEVKKSFIDEGAKVNHLTYIGDAEIGKSANIGAGVITCNYDGANKYKTKIGERAFIGSNSSLVAPVEVGENATIGAGTILRKNLSKNSLGVSIAKYVEKANWIRPSKKN